MHRSCLFVNSDPIDQSIFIAALSDISPETDCFLAVNDEEALDIMQEDGVVPDYIFIELDMPGIDGNRFLKRVREVQSLRAVPVIVHCSHPEPQCIDDLKEVGAFAIYLRPYDYWGISNLLSLYLNHSYIKANMN